MGVALRKESVDRKWSMISCLDERLKSLSARRAWIEKIKKVKETLLIIVALRKESVDRKQKPEMRERAKEGRSPQGERG